MKRNYGQYLLLIVVFFWVAYPTGCKTSTANPPTAPGYLNQADQQMGQILAGARGFYVSIQQQVADGSMTLKPTEKTAFNDFATALNAAGAAYLSYHQNPNSTTQAAALSAINVVQAKQAALPLPGAKP